jgi:hypothetical protein
MPVKLEIMGKMLDDEDEACRLNGEPEQAAAERRRPPNRGKTNPFNEPWTPGKPDPFSDVDLPRKQLPRKPDPFSDVE